VNTFDIVSAITKALKNEFPDAKLYGEEVKQGLKAPAFTVFSIQTEQEPYPNGRYRRINPFVINYFPVDKIKTRRECADVAERMIWALEYIELEPDEAPLRGTDIHHEFKDDVLHFFINYDIFLRKVKQEDPMETLHEEHMLRG
jgi:hypothetical protein